MDHEASSGPRPGSPAAAVVRDDEIRQLLEARNARRARRGEVERQIADLADLHPA